MRKLLSVLTVVLVAAMASGAYGATYYVAIGGSDSNPGSSSQPWATVQWAVDHIAPGDTIMVRPGAYAGARIESSGTAGAPKTLMAETIGTVTLNALSPVARHSGIIEVENYNAPVRFWVIDGFICNGMNHLYRPIDVRSTSTNQNSNVTVRNNTCFDALATGISCGHCDYLLVENNVSYSNGEHGTYMNNSSDYGIERNNVVYSNTSCGYHFNGDRRTGGGDGLMQWWVIEKNIAWLNPSGSAINCDGVLDSTIFNNLLYNNSGSGIALYYVDGSYGSSRDLVYNNTFVMPAGAGRNVVLISKSGKKAPVGNKLKNNILWTSRTDKCAIATYSSSVSAFESDYNVVIDRFSINRR